MVSPRRSSRARSSTHAVNSQSSHSSASSSRSRHTRHRTDDADAGTSLLSRDDDQNDANNTDSNSVAGDDMDDSQEDEITRCVCGYQEYQGGDDDAQSDTDGLFIQCDQCSVWQHGYCVGITDPDATPENYYCEKCRPDMHKEGQTKAGMKTSIYIQVSLPMTEREKERERKASQAKENQKRRTTMNSRDAEYDDEVLKRMIELSKHEAKAETARSTRGRKRGSSDEGSEEPKDSKRVRTSDSPDAQSNTAVESGDDKPVKPPPSSSSSSKKKSHKAQVPASVTSNKRTSTRNRVATEKAEQRKEVEPEIPEELPPKKSHRATNRTNNVEEAAPPPAVVQPPPDTPQQTKRPARNTANNRRRGNNRNARASEDPHEALPMSRDHSHANHSSRHDPTSVLDKPTKPRLPAARMTMNEMKRRVNGISEYITRTQVEMASTRQSDIYGYLAWIDQRDAARSNAAIPKDASSSTTPPSGGASTSGKDVPRIEVSETNDTGTMLAKASDLLSTNMNSHSLEIMEALSLKINKWQQNYGEVAL